MPARMYSALPAYFGGKRRLFGAVFADLPAPDVAPTFVDAFLGGGSVSLHAKARGYRVVCNDLADRSVAVGKGLIENSRTKLSHDDLVQAQWRAQGAEGYAVAHLAPDVFTKPHAAYLDGVLATARDAGDTRGWLLRLLAVKYALRLRPMGNFGAKTVIRQAAAGDWEEMNPNYVRDLANRGIVRHPLRVAERLMPSINGGVFSNGLENECHQGDAIEFLGRVQGDVCYMDPPYAGTLSYEKALRPLDELLNGCPLPSSKNPYSDQDPVDVLPRLFEAAAHIPTWVISYGNAKIDLGGLMDLVRAHRPYVEGRALSYAHCAALADDESRSRNQELLIIARKSR